MRVYRDVTRPDAAADALRRLRAALEARDALAFLTEAGELEQGAVDALCPARDGWGERERALRRLSCAAGRAFVAALREESGHAAWSAAAQALQGVAALQLPSSFTVSSPEGYAHYALDPGAYAASANAYVADVGPARAAAAVVLGIRSIGTSLSAVVAAATGSARTLTVRVRGESGSRSVCAEGALLATLRDWLRHDPDVLLVDEGPGATGETFLRAWEWLRALHVPDWRILLFPSHTGGITLAPAERRAWFGRARKYAPPHEDPRVRRVAGRLELCAPEDLGAGRWRQVVPGAEGEPARVSFERAKYRARDVQGRPVLLRYAGAGRWGAETEARARTLAAAGLGAPVRGSSEGFLAQPWLSGPIASPGAGGRALARAAGEYVVARAPLFRTGRAAQAEPLLELLVENAREALDPPAPLLAAAVERVRALPEREAVVADARLHPREWVCTTGGYRKVDALDHGDGLRWPGPADSAWDLAGIAVELGLDGEALAGLSERCARAGGEPRAELAAAVRAYRAVYAACALGDAAISAREALTDEDRRRLEAEVARYRAALDRELRAA